MDNWGKLTVCVVGSAGGESLEPMGHCYLNGSSRWGLVMVFWEKLAECLGQHGRRGFGVLDPFLFQRIL